MNCDRLFCYCNSLALEKQLGFQTVNFLLRQKNENRHETVSSSVFLFTLSSCYVLSNMNIL